MEYLTVKTRTLVPPQDSLLEVLDESLPELKEGDVIVISSKVVAIDEGRCVPEAEFNDEAHLTKEAQLVIPRPENKYPLTIINHVVVGNAGVDRSNSNGYITLLPADPFSSAKRIYDHLRERFQIEKLGVIISDSRSEMCRYGATGVAIGFWGFCPIQNHIGKADLFGRKIQYERSNLADGITAGAVVVMGEVANSTPAVIARDVPDLEFTDQNLKDDLFCPFNDDILKVLYERFIE